MVVVVVVVLRMATELLSSRATSNAPIRFTRIASVPLDSWALSSAPEDQQLRAQQLAHVRNGCTLAATRPPRSRSSVQEVELMLARHNAIDEHSHLRPLRLACVLNIPTGAVCPSDPGVSRRIDRLACIEYVRVHIAARLGHVHVALDGLLAGDDAGDDDAGGSGGGLDVDSPSVFLHGRLARERVVAAAVTRETHKAEDALLCRLGAVGLLDWRPDGVVAAERPSVHDCRCWDLLVGGVVDLSMRDVDDVGAAALAAQATTTQATTKEAIAKEAIAPPPQAAETAAETAAAPAAEATTVGNEARAAKRPRRAPAPCLGVLTGDCYYLAILADVWRPETLTSPADEPVRDWLARTLDDGAYAADERLAYQRRRDALLDSPSAPIGTSAALTANGPRAARAEPFGTGAKLANFRLVRVGSTALYERVADGPAAAPGGLRRCAQFAERIVGAWCLGRVLAIDPALQRISLAWNVHWVTGTQLARRYTLRS